MRSLILCGLMFSLAVQADSRTEESPFAIKTMVENLGVVWAMEAIDQETFIFTVRSGKAGLLDLNTGKVSWLSGVPEVHAQSQGGLLDVAVPPDYVPGDWIYFTYSKPGLLQAKTTLARARLESYSLTDWQDLLVSDSASLRNIHFGSRIAFDGKGHLFFSIGDRGMRSPAQDLSNHMGSILRLRMDGSTPEDNPFVTRRGALNEIWSYGHRNPQGLYYDRNSDRLWEIEHGPRGGDEINLIEKGRNYGWPEVSQGKEYFADIDVGVKYKAGMQEPLKVYIPSIAPSDLIVYSGLEFPQWNGDLLTGALKLRHLNHIVLDSHGSPLHENRYLQELNQRIRSLALDGSGRIYIGTDSGTIYRLTNNKRENK
ncbi:PQQ-dependent sugar dehydrogenase [Thiomicrorhabdus xiamenensis]|uniref:PQQ-dependent sugar dehydrogenase n=2 Tax=Thiomicrorhabdus xiamenensis TaxID=2739063 RepID=A0A7D4NT26_9GAMM|nr:PQQ-dependent sugar dehydrogenase [Thiomicrorhabdus xiamenensis]